MCNVYFKPNQILKLTYITCMMWQVYRHKVFLFRHVLCGRLTVSKNISDNMSRFKDILKTAEEIVIVTGAGLSAESGMPTFRGIKPHIWEEFDASTLLTPEVFEEDPGLVWKFYHCLRELVLKVKPNAGHMAVAQYEAKQTHKRVTVLTQNIDGLHKMAGTNNLIELHGSLFKTRCTKCKQVLANTDRPICEIFKDRGWKSLKNTPIRIKDLPHCKKPSCGGLLRPHVVWLGESLECNVIEQIILILSRCTVLLVVGPSALVFPASAFPAAVAAPGNIIAEFNIEPIPATVRCHYFFTGPLVKSLPQALTDL